MMTSKLLGDQIPTRMLRLVVIASKNEYMIASEARCIKERIYLYNKITY